MKNKTLFLAPLFSLALAMPCFAEKIDGTIEALDKAENHFLVKKSGEPETTETVYVSADTEYEGAASFEDLARGQKVGVEAEQDAEMRWQALSVKVN